MVGCPVCGKEWPENQLKWLTVTEETASRCCTLYHAPCEHTIVGWTFSTDGENWSESTYTAEDQKPEAGPATLAHDTLGRVSDAPVFQPDRLTPDSRTAVAILIALAVMMVVIALMVWL